VARIRPLASASALETVYFILPSADGALALGTVSFMLPSADAVPLVRFGFVPTSLIKLGESSDGAAINNDVVGRATWPLEDTVLYRLVVVVVHLVDHCLQYHDDIRDALLPWHLFWLMIFSCCWYVQGTRKYTASLWDHFGTT
jgi:hypothetical protein